MKDWSDVREDLGLRRTPKSSTLCKSSRRLLRSDLARDWPGRPTGPRTGNCTSARSPTT